MTQTLLNIPTPLRAYVDGKDELIFEEVNTVQDCLNQLIGQYPRLKQHLLEDNGELRKFVNIYMKDEDIRHLKGLQTEVLPDSELSIVPSIAGG